jgi:transcriptional regulator with XRE-family HTH domain
MDTVDTLPEDFTDIPDDAVLAEKLSTLSDAIRAGQDILLLRAAAIRTAARAGWTQKRIADQCSISQAAVSKILAKKPGEISIESCHNQYYLLGRLLRIAAAVGGCVQGESGRRLAYKLYVGDHPITDLSLATLRRELDKHLRKIAVSNSFRRRAEAALDDINAHTTGPLPQPLSIHQQQQMMSGWHHQGYALFDDVEGENQKVRGRLIEHCQDGNMGYGVPTEYCPTLGVSM